MSHTIYKVDGKRVKSVTTIINGQLGWSKGALIGWTRKHCLNGDDSMVLLKDAGKIGTLAHNMIEQFIKGGKVCLDDYNASQISQAKTAYYGFYEWQKKYKPNFLETELKLTSQKYKFGGTFDALCKVNGKLVICDWKTSSDYYPEFLIQLGAYRQLITENLDCDIRGAILLKLNKEEKGFDEYRFNIKDLNWGWKVFKLLLKIHDYQKQI